jgi:hypothetical protein
MKKLFSALFLFLGILYYPLFCDTMQIKLVTPFRLNPIMGINGDDNEASSKFVQRLIFSSLVFPLEDPYLQDNYSIAFDLSLIERLEYKTDSGAWADYDFSNYGRPQNPVSNFFRITLRDGLKFYQARQKRAYDDLIADDVVYSYRISRITMDRAYQNYLAKGGKLGLNTLLYSKIKSFNDVYCETSNSQNVFFNMDSNVSCEDFLKLLVYVPILSVKQVNNENSKYDKNSYEYRSLHGSLNMASLVMTGQISNKTYDFYDFNKIPKNILASFYRQPIGYGQFLIDERPVRVGGGSMDADIWKRITFTRNSEWCNFKGRTVKKIGNYSIDHSRYRSNNDKIIIETTRDTDPLARMQGLNENDVLYNIPLSASLFTDESLNAISQEKAKRKMQISHYLYGVFFGPSPQGSSIPLFKGAREFFLSLADRTRIENIVRYIRGDSDYSKFDSEIRQTSGTILLDLELQRLYYPFYMTGKTVDRIDNRSELGRYYTRLEEEDNFYQEYKSLLYDRSLSDYYLSLGDDIDSCRDVYDFYIGGTEYSEEAQSDIDEKFRLAQNYIVSNNRVNIEIFFKKDDKIGETIAIHYRDILNGFFARQGIERTINTVEIANDNSEWQRRAEANSNNNKLSLLVKGWNYKFDLLDELRTQFIDKQTFGSVETQYKELINNSNLSAETMYYRIAMPFVDEAIMIPLVGIQNYAVYNKDKFPAFDEFSDIEILLLPYYWKGN